MYFYTIVRKIISRIRPNKPEKLIDKILEFNLTYLSKDALLLIDNTIRIIEKNNIQGDIIEAGCALGGSAILIAKTKRNGRTFKIFDSFGLMPEPGNNDEIDVHIRYKEIISGNSTGIGENLYYGYEEDLLENVKNKFLDFNISYKKENILFIKGYYEETLKINNPIALAHIDCDWYDSVMVSLERITPHLSIGGFLIIDDYFYYSGCRKATDKYFADKQGDFRFWKKERLLIEKVR